nr:hypothetical protein GCM10020093_094930 [Planobispora longispora]
MDGRRRRRGERGVGGRAAELDLGGVRQPDLDRARPPVPRPPEVEPYGRRVPRLEPDPVLPHPEDVSLVQVDAPDGLPVGDGDEARRLLPGVEPFREGSGDLDLQRDPGGAGQRAQVHPGRGGRDPHGAVGGLLRPAPPGQPQRDDAGGRRFDVDGSGEEIRQPFRVKSVLSGHPSTPVPGERLGSGAGNHDRAEMVAH